eukprot:CAMPEP_0197451746 /NCGR_PEP_ID=MMETSP1175-20131217/29995_1 /TAXON_ID=1003142 /ORGANISM="Triceratium dubium, Strain CCMP147" /LENGTH=175 /DNA_ID=CAMNT_0042984569 /DNA_START=188 /DNA_END=718 /DNA_ORIENTATION=-
MITTATANHTDATSINVVQKEVRPPVPPFTKETATQKVRLAEDAWNSQDPDKVKMAYTKDTVWRNRSTFLQGRESVREFLSDKWVREQHYRLIKELWSHDGDRIAVRFCYEYFHASEQRWYRAHGNENWEFNADGLMKHRHASINDVPIEETERRFHWSKGRRPDDHPGLSELGL